MTTEFTLASGRTIRLSEEDAKAVPVLIQTGWVQTIDLITGEKVWLTINEDGLWAEAVKEETK